MGAGKSRQTSQITRKDIESALVPGDSYTNNEDYKKLDAELGKLGADLRYIEERRRQLEEELKAESKSKPKNEWDWNDETMALIGVRPMKYTAKGEKLNKELTALNKEYAKLQSRWSSLQEKHRGMVSVESVKQRAAFNKNHGGFSSSLPKTVYKGFKRGSSTTGYIDDLLKSGKARIVEMSPKRYIREIAHNIFHNATVESSIRAVSVSNINKYMQMMKKGVKFDTPYLNYRDSQQEGRHRALAAMMLGIKKIPVIVVEK